MISLILISTLSTGSALAAPPAEFHNEESDTIRITQILADECAHADAGNISRIAKIFEGTPYKASTLEGTAEVLKVNLDEFDCTTFVETVMALAYTAAEHRQSWHDFVYNLERIRYRSGQNSGYASRLHYPSEWIVDNTSRGIIKEITADLPGVRYNVKSLDFMSRHSKQYPALADSTNLAAIKHMESGFSNHRYPILKSGQIKDKTIAPHLRSGDVVLFATNKPGLDISHIGFIIMQDGAPHLLHASQKHGKVILDTLTLNEYVRHNRNEGIRIIRLLTD